MRTLAQQVGRRDRTAHQNRNGAPARVAATPEVVAVEVDGRRIRTRAEAAGPGVRQAQNKEDKIACPVTLRSEALARGPQPEPPSFLLPRRVERLVQQVAGPAGGGGGAELFRSQRAGMWYPEYRREGLPTTSSLMESLLGEVNARVKGKQKHGGRGDAAIARGGVERG